jgi:antitoxin (DNA-binding transcriptional repressor) of toxin-antitoxin stability system
MIVYTYSEARQNLASLLDQAAKEGEVRIRRRDGQIFVIRPQPRADSPLDIEPVNLDITTNEIIEFVRESRERSETNWEAA